MFLDTSDANRLRGNNSLAGIQSDFQQQMNALIAPPDQGDAASGMLTADVSGSTVAPAVVSAPAVSPSSPLPDPSAGGTDARFPSAGPTEAYIRKAAAQRGIDPETAVRVYHSEGASAYTGDNGSSFGPFQLHYGNVAGGGNAVAGLGDEFTRRTGLDARDPKTVNQQIDFALDNVKTNGWGAFHGAARVGVGQRDGLVADATSTNSTSNGYVFPVQGFQGKVQNHWGEVKGGSDLFAPRGTPVQAMRGGKVIEAGWNDVGGNSVLVQGDDGNQYYYAHFDALPSVKVGQTIQAGTYLGPVGDTGDAKGTGTHLHIGIGPSIRLGADKYGGTGGDFDAVGLLNAAQRGESVSAPTQATPQSSTPNSIQDIGANFANQLGGLFDQAGPVKDAVKDHVGEAASNFQKQLGDLLSGAGGVMQQGQDVNVAGDVALNEARREYFPNITEPNHPFNVMSELEAKYGTSLPNGKMTPEDQQRAANAMVAVGGIEMPVPPESNGARPLFGRGGVPGGNGRPEIPAASGDTQDLLQQMLDMAKAKRGANDATVQAVEVELTKMRAPATPPEEKLANAVDEVRRRGGDPKTLQGIQDSLDDLARTREIPSGPQAGQLPFDDPRFPYANPIPGDVAEAAGPRGSEVPGQMRLPGDDPVYGTEVQPKVNVQQRPPLEGPSGPQPGQMGMFGNSTLASPADAMAAAAKKNPLNTTEKILAVTKGNLLTGPVTMGLQVTGGAVETIGRPVKTLLAGEGRAALADVRAMGQGITQAWANAGDALHYGYRRTAAEMGKAQSAEVAQGWKGFALTPGLRTMTAIDEFVQTINAHGAMAMSASVESRITGRTIADLIEHPTPWMNDVVRKAVESSTYTEGASPLARAISSTKSRWLKSGKGSDKAFGVVLDVLLPFVNIPDVVVTRGLKMMAGGIPEIVQSGRIAKGVASETKGLNAAQRTFTAKTRATEGMLVGASMGMIAHWALDGQVTGEGPSNWSSEYKQQLQEARGPDGQPQWMPHSVKIGGRWVDYSTLSGPWAVPMSIIATAVEEFRDSGKPISPEVVSAAANGAIMGISRQAYLQTLSDMASAIANRDFTGFAEKTAAGLIGRALPASAALNQVARASDETKNPSNMLERVASRIPIASQLVPDKQTALGEPKRSPQDLASSLLPGHPTAPGAPEPVLRIITDAGMTVPAPPKQIAIPNSQAQIPLSQEQQDLYQRVYGQVLTQRLQPLAPMSDQFRQLPLAVRRTALAKAMREAQDQARAVTLAQMGVTGGLSVEQKPPTNLPPVAR